MMFFTSQIPYQQQAQQFQLQQQAQQLQLQQQAQQAQQHLALLELAAAAAVDAAKSAATAESAAAETLRHLKRAAPKGGKTQANRKKKAPGKTSTKRQKTNPKKTEVFVHYPQQDGTKSGVYSCWVVSEDIDNDKKCLKVRAQDSHTFFVYPEDACKSYDDAKKRDPANVWEYKE